MDTKEKARRILNNIESRLQPYASDGMLIVHGKYRTYLRCPDLFTERRGCEDDDWPDFTGRDRALAVAQEEAGTEFSVEIWESEKCWFTIELTLITSTIRYPAHD
jgi:hypothetical protein